MSKLCVSIPMELKNYCKNVDVQQTFDVKVLSQPKVLGIEVFRKPGGEIDYTAHYSVSGDIVKKIYYNGAEISSIEYFRNKNLYCKEFYDQDRLEKKRVFEKAHWFEIEYKYNRQNKVISIQKILDGTCYTVDYGYDELGRINSRQTYINSALVSEQKYRFDILNRVVEYADNNQKIKVLQISSKNELIYYEITDKMDNKISVVNHFSQFGYKTTDVTLNGHMISISDRSYADNIMLKKPYATEDDLDLIISEIFNNNQLEPKTSRSSTDGVLDNMINMSIQSRTLPISIRKRVLYNLSLNAS